MQRRGCFVKSFLSSFEVIGTGLAASVASPARQHSLIARVFKLVFCHVCTSKSLIQTPAMSADFLTSLWSILGDV